MEGGTCPDFFPLTTELGPLIPSSPNLRLGFTPLAPLAFKSSDLNRNFTTSSPKSPACRLWDLLASITTQEMCVCVFTTGSKSLKNPELIVTLH